MFGGWVVVNDGCLIMVVCSFWFVVLLGVCFACDLAFVIVVCVFEFAICLFDLICVLMLVCFDFCVVTCFGIYCIRVLVFYRLSFVLVV